MAGTPWTPAEDEILRNTTDLTARALEDVLPGRSWKAIQQRRAKLGIVVESGNIEWTRAEDLILRDTVHLSEQEVVDLLPGRTRFAIHSRRQSLELVHRKSFNMVGSRTLLAKTCRSCGFLLDATWFLWREASAGKVGYWRSDCRKCCGGHGKSDRYDPKATSASYHRLQAITKDQAHRSGERWTEADESVLDNPELTLLEKALKTSRTYSAVTSYCKKRGYTSKVGLGDAVAGQWHIQLPEAKDEAA